MFYAAPMPLIVVAGLVTGLALRRRAAVRGVVVDRSAIQRSDRGAISHDPSVHRRLRQVFKAIVLAQAVLWFSEAVSVTTRIVPEDSIRIVFCNVNRGFRGYDGLADELVAHDADVVALVEATDDGQQRNTWRERFPGYTVQTSGSGMVFLVRGSIEVIETGRSGIVSRWRLARVTTGERRFLLLLIDIASHPLRSRQPAFDDLVDLLKKYRDEPLVIAGDFNTPVNSVRYGEMRQQTRNAFEAAGEGLRETWPVVLPVLALDQIWGNDRIQWLRCRHGWSARSDHRPVIAEFTVRDRKLDR